MSDLPLLERVPPQSLEAEQSTLGAMITEREAIAPAMQLLQPDDFYNPQHQIIFRAIVDLFSEGKPADMTMLPVLLQDRAQLEQAGGTRYLCALMDSLPSAKSVKHYAAIVRQKATLRCLIQHAGEVRNLAQNPGELDANEILAQCEQQFAALKERMVNGAVKLPVEEVLDGDEDEAEEWIRLLSEPGFVQRQVIMLLVSSPKLGKTTLMHHAIRQWNAEGLSVLYLSEERRPLIRLRKRHFGLAAPLFRVFRRRPGWSWPDVVAWLSGQDFDILVIDTARHWFDLPEKGENDAALVEERIAPIGHLIGGKNAAAILCHHANRSGDYSGSTQWKGGVDIAVEMHKTMQPRRRLLKSEGRFDTTPAELLIELKDEQYRSLGNPDAIGKTELKARVWEFLADGEGRTIDYLQEDMDPQPGRGNLAQVVKEMFEEDHVLTRDGTGKKGHPFVWTRI